jgi:molybdopterin-guanine dinucleotide biosynthesis protein A
MAGSVTSVAILAGGASRRMGEDKALLRLTPSGPVMLERVLGAARAISSDVVVVCPPDRNYARFGAILVADRFPGAGPLGGIITALEASPADHTLILSCDHPFLSIPLLRWMAELPSIQLVLPALEIDSSRTCFPILARYRADALPILTSAFLDGERRLQRAIGGLSARVLGPGDLSKFDPGLRSFLNVNTLQAAQSARQLLGS